MTHYRYFFLHISLLILFLTFPPSSAHRKPEILAPPINTNNPSTPPTNTDNPNPPTCNNSVTSPPGNTNTPTSPPSNTKTPTSPPGNNNTPKSPPTDNNTPVTPPGNTNTPTSPPDNSNKPTTPPGNTNTPTSPPDNSNTPTTPPGNTNTPTCPPGDNETPASPPHDNETPTIPPGDSETPTSPPGENKSPNSPPHDKETPTTPPGDSETPTSPPSSDNKTPNTPPSGTQTPTTPPSNNNNPSTPPSENNTPNSPPSNNNNPSTPPSNPNNPITPPSGNTNVNISFKGCFSKVLAFGDSYTDTGNAHLLGGLKSFVGDLLSQFSGAKLPGYRQSNGRLMVDFLCEDLGLSYLPPFKKSSSNFSCGANFAVGGSTALASEFFNRPNIGHPLMWKGTPQNFQTQVDWFSKYMHDMACKRKDESTCKAEMGNSLFWIGDMGGNDYARILGSLGSPFSMRSLAETAVGQVSKLLTQLLEKGAKYIVVQGVPPIGCCPLQLLLSKSAERDGNGCSSIANAVIKSHNELLQKSLMELQKRFSDCTILYADVWGAYHHILENYKKFKFSEPFKACCGAGGGPLNFKLHSLCGSLGTSTCQDPSNHIIWDGIHFTEAMYKHLAELILRGGFTKPIPFDQLIKLKLGLTTKASLGLGGTVVTGAGMAGTIGAAGAGAGLLPNP